MLVFLIIFVLNNISFTCDSFFIRKSFISKDRVILFDTNNKNSKIVIKPEFSRIININQIPQRKSIICKLLARETERKGLEKRFDIPSLILFNANVTISRL
jgi:hypothetical protein